MLTWDEQNLHSNAEYHRLNPPTMKIDEPKTPFVHDDDGRLRLDDDDHRQLHLDGGDHHSAVATASSRRAVDDHDAFAEAAAAEEDKTWADAEFNHVASRARASIPLAVLQRSSQQRVAVTSPAIGTAGQSTISAGGNAGLSTTSFELTSGPAAAGGEHNPLGASINLESIGAPPLAQHNNPATYDAGDAPASSYTSRSMSMSASSFSALQQRLSRQGLSLTIAAPVSSNVAAVETSAPVAAIASDSRNTTTVEEAETVGDDPKLAEEQHNIEFIVMRKAVYRDEGAKFKEMMAKAKAAAAAEDDDDDDDE
jgi:hypothetical protein